MLLVTAALAAVLTLQDAASEALQRNPSILAASASRDAAAARLAMARAAWWPRLELSESATRGNNPVFVFGTLLEQGRFGAEHFDPRFLNDPDPLTNHRIAATARYTLFDRLARRSDEATARNAVTRAALASDEREQRLIADVVGRFYGIVLADARRDVAAEAVRSAEADVSAVRDRFEQGLVVESDVLAAQVQLARFRQQLIAAEGEAAVARASLATLLQRPATDALEVDGDLPELKPAAPLEEVLARAIEKRASVQIAATQTSDAQSRATTARAAILPRVDAFVTGGASDRNSDYTAAVVATFDLFDRARPARFAAARADVALAKTNESAARDAVTMEVVAAWHRLRSARETIGVAAASVEQADAASRIVRDRYEHGLTTVTEQLRAQTALVAARFDLLAARYETIVAHAELLRATGDLEHVQNLP